MPKNDKAVSSLMEYLHKNSSSIKDNNSHVDTLVSEIVRYDDGKSIEHIFLTLRELKKKDSQIIEYLFSILYAIPFEKVVSVLVEQLEQGSVKYKLMLLKWLNSLPGLTDNDQTFDVMVNVLGDSNDEVRSMAISILGNIDSEAAFMALRKHVIVEDNFSILNQIVSIFSGYQKFDEEDKEIPLDKFKELVELFSEVIPGFKIGDDVYDIEEGYTLGNWIYEVVLGEEYCVYIEKFQYDIDEFNILVPLKSASITLSDDALYNENDELINIETNPYELLLDHLNSQLESYDLMMVELGSHENPTFICISTIDKKKLKKLYAVMDELEL